MTAVMHGMSARHHVNCPQTPIPRFPLAKHLAVGKGYAHLVDGSYVCMYDGDGVLSFEKDAEQVGFDATRREYAVKITARS